MSTNQYRVLIFTEHCFERDVVVTSLAEARAYSDGFSDGCNLYGSGSHNAYVIPGDEEEMKEFETQREIKCALPDVVCYQCFDAHISDRGGTLVNCSSCPVPCQKCRQGGVGAYCEETPCKCECHAHKKDA